MKTLLSYLKSQFGNPRGLIGYLAGFTMLYKNDDRLNLVVERLGIRGEETILELGCGPGAAIRKIAAQLTSGHITAFDRSPIMLRMAARHNQAAITQNKVTLLSGAYPNVDLSPAHYDVIFGVNVSLFWENPVSVLQQIRTHLREQGRLHLFFHPHWEKDNGVVHSIGDQLLAQVSQAGLSQPELQFEPMTPVDMIHVKAIK